MPDAGAVAALKDTEIERQSALVNEGNIGLIKNLEKNCSLLM